MKIQKTKTGYSVRYKTEFGVRTTRLSSTSEKEARKEVKDAKIAELEAAANAGALTMDVIAKMMSGRNLTCQDALDEWNEWRESEGKSNNTINAQTDFIHLFCRGHHGMDKPVNTITHKMISKWVNNPKSKVGVSTRNAWLSAISAFLSFCSTRQYVPKNPASIVSVNMGKLSHEQKEKKKVVPFTEKEYKKIVNEAADCFQDGSAGEFWVVASTLSYWLGLRLGDIINLEWESLSKTHITIWTEKKDTRVKLPLNHKLTGGKEVPNALAVIPYNEGKFVFAKHLRDKINSKKRNYFSQQFRELMNRLEVEGKSFHCFRHAFATRHKNLPLEDVAKMLGHKNTKTTKGYTH
jgi:integrase